MNLRTEGREGEYPVLLLPDPHRLYVLLDILSVTYCLNFAEYIGFKADVQTSGKRRNFHNLSNYTHTHIHTHIPTNPSTGAGRDTRSIFKQGLTDLNSEFSFF